jgi:protein-S-isoprenylcysteine O-methyltransferase Ste14
MEKKEHKKIDENTKGVIHFILINSYVIFLFAVIFGVLFDSFFHVRIFSHEVYKNIGFLMIILGTIFIYWAQKSSKNNKKIETKNQLRSFFELGPYKYLRNPTHLSLFVVTLGLSLVLNSFFGVVLNIVAYVITRFGSLKKQERLLSKKHGQVYDEYKKRVKNWL